MHYRIEKDAVGKIIDILNESQTHLIAIETVGIVVASTVKSLAKEGREMHALADIFEIAEDLLKTTEGKQL